MVNWHCRINAETIKIKADPVTADDLMTLAIWQLENIAQLLAEVGFDPVRGSKLAKVIVKKTMADGYAVGAIH